MWSGLLAPAAAQSQPEPPALQRISPHVWRIAAPRGEPGPDNQGFVSQLMVVADGARLWLLGAGPTPAQGRALDALLRGQFGRGATDLLITRAAPSLALGSAGIAASRVWALDDVARAMAQRCTHCLQRLRRQIGEVDATLHPALIRLPNRKLSIGDGLPHRLGPFSAWALPRAPGERVLVLRHQADRVLMAQGLLWVGGVPDLRETDSNVMQASLRTLRGLADGCRVLGEQGGVGSVADMDVQQRYIASLQHRIDQALLQGRGEAEPARGWPGFAPQAEDARLHALNWQRVWREREALVLR